jgi:hypothetical protein
MNIGTWGSRPNPIPIDAPVMPDCEDCELPFDVCACEEAREYDAQQEPSA